MYRKYKRNPSYNVDMFWEMQIILCQQNIPINTFRKINKIM